MGRIGAMSKGLSEYMTRSSEHIARGADTLETLAQGVLHVESVPMR